MSQPPFRPWPLRGGLFKDAGYLMGAATMGAPESAPGSNEAAEHLVQKSLDESSNSKVGPTTDKANPTKLEAIESDDEEEYHDIDDTLMVPTDLPGSVPSTAQPPKLAIEVQTKIRLLPAVKILSEQKPGDKPKLASVCRAATLAYDALLYARENGASASLQGRCAYYIGLAQFLNPNTRLADLAFPRSEKLAGAQLPNASMRSAADRGRKWFELARDATGEDGRSEGYTEGRRAEEWLRLLDQIEAKPSPVRSLESEDSWVAGGAWKRSTKLTPLEQISNKSMSNSSSLRSVQWDSNQTLPLQTTSECTAISNVKSQTDSFQERSSVDPPVGSPASPSKSEADLNWSLDSLYESMQQASTPKKHHAGRKAASFDAVLRTVVPDSSVQSIVEAAVEAPVRASTAPWISAFAPPDAHPSFDDATKAIIDPSLWGPVGPSAVTGTQTPSTPTHDHHGVPWNSDRPFGIMPFSASPESVDKAEFPPPPSPDISLLRPGPVRQFHPDEPVPSQARLLARQRGSDFYDQPGLVLRAVNPDSISTEDSTENEPIMRGRRRPGEDIESGLESNDGRTSAQSNDEMQMVPHATVANDINNPTKQDVYARNADSIGGIRMARSLDSYKPSVVIKDGSPNGDEARRRTH